MDGTGAESISFLASHGIIEAIDNVIKQDISVEQSDNDKLTYELIFNAACAYLQTSPPDASRALAYLTLARKTLTLAPEFEPNYDQLGCDEQMESNLDRGLLADLIAIVIQQGIALHALKQSSSNQLSQFSPSSVFSYATNLLNLVREGTSAPSASIDQAALVLQLNSLALPSISSTGVVSTVPGEQAGSRTADVPSLFNKLSASVPLCDMPDKLLPHQRNCLLLNLTLLAAHARKPEEARAFLARIPKAAFPTSDFAVLVESYLCFRAREFEKAESVIKKFADASPSASINAKLALPHMAILRESYSHAATLLEEWADNATAQSIAAGKNIVYRRAPAVLATLIALRERANETEAAAKEIDSSIVNLQSQLASKKTPFTSAEYDNLNETLTYLQQRSADLKAGSGDVDGAIALLDDLIAASSKKNDHEAVDRFNARKLLLSASSTVSAPIFNLRMAPPVFGVDAQQLIQQGIPKSTSQNQTSDDTKKNAIVPNQFLPNGKRRFSQDKLAKVRDAKRAKRISSRQLPSKVTPEMASAFRELQASPGYVATQQAPPTVIAVGKKKKGQAAAPAAPVGPDPYRWMPKWERPATATGKYRSKQKSGKFSGPQGSGIAEREVEMSKHMSTSNAQVAVDKQKAGKKRRR